MVRSIRFAGTLALLLPWTAGAWAHADSDEDLAKKTQNPVAALISVPIQGNFDNRLGPGQTGTKIQVNVQPVVPFSLGPDWNLISRTIAPIISQKNMLPDGNGLMDASGIGNIQESLFFSPKEPTARGWIWGAGPVFLLPKAAGNDYLGYDKAGLGPTFVVLKQAHGWTVGMLGQQLWSLGGDSASTDPASQPYSSSYVQPFLNYTTHTYTTAGVNTESTYDWRSRRWVLVPVNLYASQLLRLGGQPLSIQVGARRWAHTITGAGPEGWGYRVAVTFLFPNK
jgi:hypothetical protein